MNNLPQVKMVRPFAEAEARERERRARKEIERQERERERQERERQEQELKQNAEPRTVKMVRPFAEAEVREREEKAKRERAEKIRKEQQQANTNNQDSSSSNVIPDQLNITIRTSIPGYQKISYKPSMTIKDSNSKGVQFDPLIRLNKSTVDKIPEEYRIKQFFSKDLFQSLKNHINMTPARSLLYASKTGIVDNNIKVTLATIFPDNSVITIGKKQYVIGDVQWTTGDWKIDLKQKKEEIDPDKITDPIVHRQLVREEIISGEEQLRRLPATVIIGDNYSGPPVPVVASGVTTQPTTTQLNANRQLVNPNYLEMIPVEEPIQNQEIISLGYPYDMPFVEEMSPEEENLYNSFETSIQYNNESTREFVAYFSTPNFYKICNMIYLNVTPELQNFISMFYKTN
jgi:hypothetical protein